MSEAFVIPMSSGEFVLQIQSADRSVEHRVDVPNRLLDELGVSRDRAKQVIEASLDWFRAHEPDRDLPSLVDLGVECDRDAGLRGYLFEEVAAAERS